MAGFQPVDTVLADATDFFLRDGHGAGNALGAYRVDRTRSAFYTPRTKGFPKNTDLRPPSGPWTQEDLHLTLL